MAHQQTEHNRVLIEELRELARRGARTIELMSHIRKTLGFEDGMVPILAYLCRAFSVPLRTLLPLREDEGKGPFARAAQVTIWFSSLITRNIKPEPWDWEVFWTHFDGTFSAKDLEYIAVVDGTIGFVHPPRFPGDLYARAVFDTYIDQVELPGASAEMFHRVEHVASAFREVLTGMTHASNGEMVPLRLNFGYQIDDQPPKLHVVCMVEALREVHAQYAAGALAGSVVS